MIFFKKNEKKGFTEYNYPMPLKTRFNFFLSLDALTSQAEYHFNNKNYELSEGIFELMIKHIEKNKSIKLVDYDDFPDIPKSEPTIH